MSVTDETSTIHKTTQLCCFQLVTPKQTEKSKLYAVTACVKYINIFTQMKATKTKAQDEYSVWIFLNETWISPMHFFSILFQVSIWCEFTVIKKKKTTTNDGLTRNESL